MSMTSEVNSENSVGRRVERARAEIGWRQEDLASASGLSTATISAIENGKTNPTMLTLGKIAMALNVGIASLIEEG